MAQSACFVEKSLQVDVTELFDGLDSVKPFLVLVFLFDAHKCKCPDTKKIKIVNPIIGNNTAVNGRIGQMNCRKHTPK